MGTPRRSLAVGDRRPGSVAGGVAQQAWLAEGPSRVPLLRHPGVERGAHRIASHRGVNRVAGAIVLFMRIGVEVV